MKRFALSIIFLFAALTILSAQTDTTWINPPAATGNGTTTVTRTEDTLTDPPTIADLPNEFAVLDTVPPPQRYFSRHMLGLRYFYGMSTISSNPRLGESFINDARNFGVMYTYYHPLWDHINIFGLQMGLQYSHIGYGMDKPNTGYGEKVTELQFLFGSQIHLDIKEHGRILINIGPYYGYRLKTDKEGGFDENDIRHDFGAYGGIGFALVFKNLEAHIEGNYQYSFCSMYHTYKYSDLYWLTAYPQNIYIGVTVYYNLW